MAIVWPCALSVDAYAALGKKIDVPRPNCPGCAGAMTFWSGYFRPVRTLGICVRLFVRRARCRACELTHALLPAFVLVKRLDPAEAIGVALEAVLGGRSGVRPVARALGVPHTTARGWVRRFAERSDELAMSFGALSVELGAVEPGPVLEARQRATGAIRRAFGAACELANWAALGAWRFSSVVSGGRLIATNTISPYLFVGKRRFMPPVPFPDDEEDPTDGT